VLHAKTLPGNPYDGHTLGSVIDATEKLTGCAIERAHVDKGYRGHDAANSRRVFISGQKRGVFGAIQRELRRRSAIEPVIGHIAMAPSAAAISKAKTATPERRRNAGRIQKGAIYFARALRATFGFLGGFGRRSGGWGGLLRAKHQPLETRPVAYPLLTRVMQAARPSA
jgi:hypothetical protein